MRVVASLRKSQDLFTASQIARFCQVDLKTIHNWADRGQIPHFRTPGRHLRFRRPHVLDFLRKYGYPIPNELDAGRPRVALITHDLDGGAQVRAALGEDFELVEYDNPVSALLQIGENPPDAVVLAAHVGALTGPEIIEALKSEESTKHIRAVLLTDDGVDRSAALRAGASALVRASDTGGLRNTVEALMGLRH